MKKIKIIFGITYSSVHIVDSINCRPRVCESNKTIAFSNCTLVIDNLRLNKKMKTNYLNQLLAKETK